MSREIDEKIVSMRLDNRDFEANARESMSTLEKLKSSLQFKKSSDGLDSVARSAKDANPAFEQMGGAVETVKMKLSMLQITGIEAMRRIANSALDAGKNLVKAFTVDPIKTGMQEFETQIGSIQTILANTSKEGTTLDQVNDALDELNHYADKTIYNFTQMTKNIGTFTAAGVKLDTSVGAIKGIANLAAVSGSTSQQASTAMYQLSQALATGTVKLQDWNSVVNAGMGGQVFQDALMRTAEAMRRTNREYTDITGQTHKYGEEISGVISQSNKLKNTGAETIKELVQGYGSFRESLSQGQWLTTEVLTETLNQFAGVEAEIDTATLKAKGYTEEEIKSIQQMAKTAEEAATKVRTASQLMDTLKEAAQSGWTQSWEYILGDFEHATELFSYLSDTFSDILGKSADRRNEFLGDVMLSGWQKVKNAINETGANAADFQTKITEVAKKHGTDVDKLIEKYGTFEKAVQGENWLTEGIQKEALKELVAEYDKMTDEQLASKKITREQVDELKKLVDGTSKLKDKFDGLFQRVGAEGGWQTLFNSLKNFMEGFKNIGSTISNIFRDVFKDAFGPSDALELAEGIERLSERFKNFFSDTGKGAIFLKNVLTPVLTFIKDRLADIQKFFQQDGIGGKVIAMIKNDAKALGTNLFNAFSGIQSFATEKGPGIVDFLKTAGGTIRDFLSKIDPKTAIAVGGAIAFLINKLKPKKKDEGLFGSLKGTIGSIKGAFSSLGDALEAYKARTKTKTVKDIATSILMLSASLKIISTIPADQLAASVGVLTGMMAGLVGVYASLSAISNKNSKSIKGIAGLTIVLGEIAAVIYILTKVVDKPESVIPICTGISELMVAMGAMLAIISNTRSLSGGEIGKLAATLGVMSGVAVALGLAVTAFANLAGENPWAAIPIVTATSILMTAIAGVLFILSVTPQLANPVASIASFTALAALAAAIGYFLVRWSNDIKDPEAIIVLANQISKLLIVLTGVCTAAALIGTFAGPALAGIGVLAALVAAMVGVIEGIGLAMRKSKAFEENLVAFKKFMGLLGEAFGSFAGGLLEGFSDNLPDVGSSLSDMMTNLKPFLDGLSALPDDIDSKIGAFKKLLSAITGAELKDALAQGISKWFGAETDIGAFGKNLKAFAASLGGISSQMKGVDLNDIEKIVNIFTRLGGIKVETGHGIFAIFMGKDNMVTFGKQLVKFAKYLKEFSKETEDIGDVQHLLSVSLAMQRIMTAASDINTGNGVGGLFTGKDDIETFGKQLKAFGKSLVEFADSVKDIDVSAGGPIDKACAALNKILSIEIPTSGGFLSIFKGSNDIGSFGDKLEDLGKGIEKFIESTSTQDFDLTRIELCITVLKHLLDVPWPSEGGLISKIMGGNNGMGSFGESLEDLAKGIGKWAENTKDVDITQSNNAVNALIYLLAAFATESLSSALTSAEGKGFKTFVENIDDIGENLKSLSDKGKDISTTNIGNITSALNSLSTVDYSKLEGISKIPNDIVTKLSGSSSQLMRAGAKLANDILTGLTSVFSGNAMAEKMNTIIFAITTSVEACGAQLATAGDQLGAGLETGIINRIASITSAGAQAAAGAVSGILSQYANAIAAGQRLDAGVASGISRSQQQITRALISALNRAINAGKIKAFSGGQEVGRRLVEGIANGISTTQSKVKTAVENALTQATNTTVQNTAKTDGDKVGQALVTGLTNALKKKENLDDAYQAGYKLGQEAARGVKDGAKTKSPSRETIWVGEMMVAGLVNALNSGESTAQTAGVSLARSVLGGLNTTLSTIDSNSIGLTPYTAKISPVMDLSKTRQGFATLSSDINRQAYSVGATVTSATRSKVAVEFANADAIKNLSNKIDAIAANRTSEDYLATIAANSQKNIYLNGKTLVGELTPDIDASLGRRVMQQARYSR